MGAIYSFLDLCSQIQVKEKQQIKQDQVGVDSASLACFRFSISSRIW